MRCPPGMRVFASVSVLLDLTDADMEKAVEEHLKGEVCEDLKLKDGPHFRISRHQTQAGFKFAVSWRLPGNELVIQPVR